MKKSIDIVLNSKKAKILANRSAVDCAQDKSQVGSYLESFKIDTRIVSHHFEAHVIGYGGWVWEIIMSRPHLSKELIIYSTNLVAGKDSIVPPVWVPWVDRILPSDVQTWDALAYKPNDTNLVHSGLPRTDITDIEKLALWRTRVISPIGKNATIKRWLKSRVGSRSKTKKIAKNICINCGYFVPLSGQLGQGFGACSNAFSPNDGSVVSINNGCGSHSETSVPLGVKYISKGKLFFQDNDLEMKL
ncbi:MAG: DUF3027 domain-containing protein [Bifidobacteriaceae bacterium]|jgi:hypothetical protein|nr:DUF3027 domain-containing protein [Bifidobacteriaceae bacterium]